MARASAITGAGPWRPTSCVEQGSNMRRLASQSLAELVPPHNQRGQATGTRYRASLTLPRGACRERYVAAVLY